MAFSIGHFDVDVYAKAEMSFGKHREIASKFGVTDDEFCQACMGDQSIGILFDGRPVGGALIDENRLFHIAVLPEFQGRWATVFPRVLHWAWSISHPFYACIVPENKKAKSLFRYVNARLVRGTNEFELYEVCRPWEK